MSWGPTSVIAAGAILTLFMFSKMKAKRLMDTLTAEINELEVLARNVHSAEEVQRVTMRATVACASALRSLLMGQQRADADGRATDSRQKLALEAAIAGHEKFANDMTALLQRIANAIDPVEVVSGEGEGTQDPAEPA